MRRCPAWMCWDQMSMPKGSPTQERLLLKSPKLAAACVSLSSSAISCIPEQPQSITDFPCSLNWQEAVSVATKINIWVQQVSWYWPLDLFLWKSLSLHKHSKIPGTQVRLCEGNSWESDNVEKVSMICVYQKTVQEGRVYRRGKALKVSIHL